MKQILQRLTTITVFEEETVTQPKEDWVDIGDCNRITIFTQVYGFTTYSTNPTVGIEIQNSATGDKWVKATATIVYGKNQEVILATDTAKFVGPLYRWVVFGASGNTAPASISFRAAIVGEKTVTVL